MNNIKDNAKKVVIRIAILFFIGWMGFGVFKMFENYTINVYPLVQAEAYFERADGSNNLHTVADNIEQGMIFLESLTGNEAWIFPTIETDMDSIKADLIQIINNTRALANMTVYGSDAYQEALDNAKEALMIQRERIYAVRSLYADIARFGDSKYLGKTASLTFWGWVFILLGVLLVLGAMVYGLSL